MTFSTPQIVWASLLAVWTLILSLSCFLLHFHRHHPSILPRFPLLTYIGIVCHWIIFAEISLTIILPDTIPCQINLWIAYILINLWVLSLEGRFLRFAVLYKSAEWNLSWMIGEKKRKSPKSVRNADKYASQEPLEARVWFHRYRTLLTERAILYGIGIVTLCLACVTMIIQFNDPVLMTEHRLAPHCYMDWLFVPFYVMVSLHLLFLAVLACVVRKCADVYGIRRELYVSLVLGVMSFVLVRCLDADEVYEFFGSWYIPQVWLFLGMMLAHLLSVVHPIVLIVRKRRNPDIESAQFSNVLDMPDLYEEFKAFSVKDFTIENVLFHEHHVHFMHTFSSHNGQMGRPSVRLLRDMYHTFIKQGAPMELNLTSNTMQAVRKKYQSGHLERDMFLQVEAEVLELMRYNTFPRFIQQRKRQDAPTTTSKPDNDKHGEGDDYGVGTVTGAYYSKERRQEIEELNRHTHI